ncbi:GNAT family N-acetyltransferase [Alcaligenaceae bacterium]|nr:GNAT family N-acetyltransferase [Alcaligenaceae bacterium]
MPRHRLIALFEPRSVLVIADRPLPMVDNPPARLSNSFSYVQTHADEPVNLPAGLAGVPEGGRLDQAIVRVAPTQVPQVLEALRAYQPRCVSLLLHHQPSAYPLEDMAYCRAWAALNNCVILGPRSSGVQRPHLGLNLSEQPRSALQGRVALVAQSRSIASAVLDWAQDISLGFSTVISIGDEAVLDMAEVLEYLALDARTDSIALYLEEATSSRRFSSALRAAASVKPVIVLKVGRESESSSVQDAVFNALLNRAGAVRVRFFVQLFSALKVLVYAQRPRGKHIALFSNGSGASQLAIDVMDGSTVSLAELSNASIKALDEILEEGARSSNPVVTYSALTPESVKKVMEILLADQGVDGVLALLSPDPLSDLPGVARQLASMVPSTRKPLITCFLGDATMRPLRHVLDAAGSPAFRTPESAANAFGILASYHYNQVLSQQTLPSEPLGKPPLLDEARALVRKAESERRLQLGFEESQRVLDCFHAPLSYASTGSDGCDDAAQESLPMAIRVRRDPKFGPYITFGSGGQDALITVAYKALELPPLNSYLARQLIQRSNLWRRALSKQIEPLALEALIEVLECVSQIVSDLPTLETLTIDPLYARDNTLEARNVRIELSPRSMLVLPETSGYGHMAIHPYPRRLVQPQTFKDGSPWMLRPIRPEDAESLQEFIRGLSDESRYMRFVSMLRELTPRMLARYSRIDYDRELALVATVTVPNPENRGHPREQIIGFAHYLRNADGRGAEYALVIGDDWQRRGLGAQLMRGLIEAAQYQGLTYIDGVVLASNRPMLSLMTHLGFRNDVDEEDPSMRRVWLDLGETSQSR